MVQLHCRTIGGPAVQISWEKDGEGLQGNEPRLTLMENGTLQITDTKVVYMLCTEHQKTYSTSNVRTYL